MQGLVDGAPLPPWLTDAQYLSPLLVAYDQRLAEQVQSCWVFPKPCWLFHKPCWLFLEWCRMFRKPCWLFPEWCRMFSKPCRLFFKPCRMFFKPCRVFPQWCRMFPGWAHHVNTLAFCSPRLLSHVVHYLQYERHKRQKHPILLSFEPVSFHKGHPCYYCCCCSYYYYHVGLSGQWWVFDSCRAGNQTMPASSDNSKPDPIEIISMLLPVN